MSNINWGNLFNNFSNGFNTGVQNFGVNNANPLNVEHEVYTPFQNTQESSPLPLAAQQMAQTAAELAQLNQQQTVNMLKELLQMPKNFEQLVQQLAANNAKTPGETALLLLASTLNMSQLSSLLQNSSKEAMAKLYQMVAQYNQLGVSMKNEQLGEISKLISFVMASSSSDVQTLKATLLMYLPWLPLTDPEAFKLEMAKKEEEQAGSSDDSITILIATENYGNVKADIFKTGEDGIKIEFTSSTTFPQKDFDIAMKEISKKYSININISFTQKEVFNKKKNEKTQTQVSMRTSPGVNPFLLLISNSVIKNIHTIDEKENLREARKEKLQ